MIILSQIIGFLLSSIKMFSWLFLFWMAYLAIKLAVAVFRGIKSDGDPFSSYGDRFSKVFCRMFRYQISFCKKHKIIKRLVLLVIPIAIVFCNSYAAYIIPFMNNLGIHKTYGTHYYYAVLTNQKGVTEEGIAKLVVDSYPLSFENEIFIEEFDPFSTGSTWKFSDGEPIYLNQNSSVKRGDITVKCFVTVFPYDEPLYRKASSGWAMDALSWWLLGFLAFGIIAYVLIWRATTKECEIATRPNKLKFSIAMYRICQALFAIVWVWGALRSSSTKWFMLLIPILLFCLCNGKPGTAQQIVTEPPQFATDTPATEASPTAKVSQNAVTIEQLQDEIAILKNVVRYLSERIEQLEKDT